MNQDDSFPNLVLNYWSYEPFSLEKENEFLRDLFRDRQSAEKFAFYFKKVISENKSAYMEPVYENIYQTIKGHPALKQELKDFTQLFDSKNYPQMEEKVFTDIIHGYVAEPAFPNSDVMDDGIINNISPDYKSKDIFRYAVSTYFREVYPISKTIEILIKNKQAREFLTMLKYRLPNVDYFDHANNKDFLNMYGNVILIASRLPGFHMRIFNNQYDDTKEAIEKYINEHGKDFGMKKKKSSRRSRRKSGQRKKKSSRTKRKSR